MTAKMFTSDACCRLLVGDHGPRLYFFRVMGRVRYGRHTVRYTELSPVRFKGLWKD
jgi:hypothetical protein